MVACKDNLVNREMKIIGGSGFNRVIIGGSGFNRVIIGGSGFITGILVGWLY